MRILIPLAAATVLAACQQPANEQSPTNSSTDGDRSNKVAPNSAASDNFVPPIEPSPTDPPKPAAAGANPLAFELTVAEWRKAENRDSCAPLVLTDDGGQTAEARRAEFAGGWAVAFDQPRLRSAYGVAGTGVRVANEGAEIERIKRLFPYSRPIGGRAGRLPGGSTAAYGIEGAKDYLADNPDGKGQKSLAYVVIPGQRCLYNVWSSLGRAHLESLLDHLTMVPTD